MFSTMADTVGAAHSFRGRDSNQCSSSSNRGEQEDPTLTHGAVRELVEADSDSSPQTIFRQQHRQKKKKQL